MTILIHFSRDNLARCYFIFVGVAPCVGKYFNRCGAIPIFYILKKHKFNSYLVLSTLFYGTYIVCNKYIDLKWQLYQFYSTRSARRAWQSLRPPDYILLFYKHKARWHRFIKSIPLSVLSPDNIGTLKRVLTNNLLWNCRAHFQVCY